MDNMYLERAADKAHDTINDLISEIEKLETTIESVLSERDFLIEENEDLREQIDELKNRE